jgi:NtrC-family two-component system response regulator AlgB
MRDVMGTIRRAAHSDASVLLRGETGSGKGVCAEALHGESLRRDQPFVVVHCATLSEDAAPGVLFGQAAALNGAVREEPGLMERAHRGTLFLDEIGEMPLSVQAKVLRFLQERRYERVGETQTRVSDVRIVSATNRNVEADLANGRVRPDLFFRLNVIEIHIPALRERPEDILPLVRHFMAVGAAQQGRPVPQLSKRAADLLCAYSWPGNIRELRNTIERALILWPGNLMEEGAFPERLAGITSLRPFVGGNYAVDEIEQEHIQRVINQTPTLEKAAAILGIDHTTLWRKRKRYLADRATGGKASSSGLG